MWLIPQDTKIKCEEKVVSIIGVGSWEIKVEERDGILGNHGRNSREKENNISTFMIFMQQFKSNLFSLGSSMDDAMARMEEELFLTRVL